jgi:hypothetical protein
MARAIIHNSNYKTLDDAKAAIDRYFADRNAHFLRHPRKAGRKIWGKEREPAEFSEANSCKDPIATECSISFERQPPGRSKNRVGSIPDARRIGH